MREIQGDTKKKVRLGINPNLRWRENLSQT